MFICSMRASGGHPGQDEDQRGPGEEAMCPDPHHGAVFPELLQHPQEANELLCDMPNPFFFSHLHNLIPIAIAKLIWLQLTSILRRLKRMDWLCHRPAISHPQACSMLSQELLSQWKRNSRSPPCSFFSGCNITLILF